FIEADSIPGRAANRYQERVGDDFYDFFNNPVRSPWDSLGPGRTVVYGRRDPYAEWGPITITRSGRLRVDVTELTGLSKWLGSFVIGGSNNVNHGPVTGPCLRSYRGALGFNRTKMLRVRMSLRASLSTSSGISSVSLYMRATFSRSRRRIATLPM